MRAVVIVVGVVAMGIVDAARPAVGVATELCRVRSKALVVRDVCRPREETLGPAQKAELGMEGPQGGRGTHGPSTGDLRVLDADGAEVGVVAGTEYYYGSATAVGRLTLPNASEPEFIVAQVDGHGLSAENECEDQAQAYRTSNCEGEAFVQCFGDDECARAPFARPVLRNDAATACYIGDPSEAETGNFFRRFRVRGLTPISTIQSCTFQGGTMVVPPAPCRPGSSVLCGQCCRSAPNITVLPLHFIDASLVGTPPFRLAR